MTRPFSVFKVVFLFPLIALFLLPMWGSAQVFGWAKQLPASHSSNARSFATDDNGNLFLAGTYTGSINFGNLPTLGFSDKAFIVKTDSTGEPIWAKSFLPNIADTGNTPFAGLHLSDIDLDQSGNIYAVGTFRDFIQIENTIIYDPNYPAHEKCGYLVKFDPLGQLVWLNVFSGIDSGYNYVEKVHVDVNGNPLIAGTFVNGMELDGTNILAGDDSLQTAYLAKFSPNGTLIWKKNPQSSQFQNPASNNSLEIKSDATGAIYWAGFNNGAASLDGLTLINQGSFLVKFSSGGQISWNVDIEGTTSSQGIDLDSAGNIYGAFSFWGNITFQGTNYIQPFNTYNLLVYKLDSNSTVEWVRQISAGGAMNLQNLSVNNTGKIHFSGHNASTVPLTFGDGIVIPGGIGQTQLFLGSINTNGFFESAQYLDPDIAIVFDLKAGSGQSLYLTGLNTAAITLGPDSLFLTNSNNGNFYAKGYSGGNSVTGNVFDDLNLNGVFDAGDVGVNQLLNINHFNATIGSYYGGSYTCFLPWDSVIVKLLNPPLYYNSIPDSHLVNFITFPQAVSNKDFALQAIGTVDDLSIIGTPLTNSARAGRPFTINLTCKNVGTTQRTPTVNFNYGSTLVFSHATIPVSSHVGNELSWNLPVLNPHQKHSFQVTFDVPQNTPLNDTLLLFGEVLPLLGDTTTHNNSDTLDDVVTGPYDPNDKQVVPSGPITQAHVANGEWLTYTVRFQNTGNDTAFEVVIRDEISALLDLTSFESLASSDPFSVEIKGNDLAFIFNNIQLPDSNVNEPESHGFVKYRIKAKSSAIPGDVIENTAHIYFDFNAAIITNTTHTPVENDPGNNAISEPNALAPWMNIYPNPGNGLLRVKALGLPEGPIELIAFSVLGVELQRWSFDSAEQLYNHHVQLKNTESIVLFKVQYSTGEMSQMYLQNR